MENKKSTPVIVIGIAVFIFGGALLFLVLRGKSSSPGTARPTTAAGVAATARRGAVSLTAGTAAAPAVSVQVPSGENAVALQMDYFGGGGGYVRTGDKVNIYAIVNKDCKTTGQPAAVKLVFSNADVLQVLSQGPVQSGSPTSFLLAMTPAQTEKLLFQSHVNTLYFALTSANEPAATTTGVTCANAF